MSTDFSRQNIISNEFSRQFPMTFQVKCQKHEINSILVSAVEKIISLKENIISYNNNFVTWLLSTCLSWRPKSSFFLHNQLTLIE